MEKLKHEEPDTPTRRLNIQYHGSELYDSFEFRQIKYQLNKAIHASNVSSPASQDKTHQLNKATQGSNASSPAYVFNLNSPFYQRHLNRIHRENVKTTRRISGPQVPDKRACRRETREKSFVTRLWSKVKNGLLGKKHEGEEGRNQPSQVY